MAVHSGQEVKLATEGNRLTVDIPAASIAGSGTLTALSVTDSAGVEGWKIALSGEAKLVGPATLGFKHDFAKGEPAPLVTSTEDGTTLTAADGVIVEGNIAVVTTTHFSTWFTMWWNDVLDKARARMDKFYAGTGKAPSCTDEAKAKQKGYKVTSDSGSRVYWCLGLDGSGAPQLKVTNARGYFVGAESSPGITPQESGANDLIAIVSNIIKERPSLAGNTVTLVGPGETVQYKITGSGQSGVRVQPSVPGYLVTAAQYAVDTLGEVLGRMGKGGMKKGALESLFDWESCLSGYSSMMTAKVETARQATTYFDDAVGTTLGCMEKAIGKAGLGFIGTTIASGISWLVSGVRTAMNGFGAAADTALNPSGYTIYVTAPTTIASPATAPPVVTAPAGFPAALSGTWCTKSDPNNCFSAAELVAQHQGAFVADTFKPDALGTTGYDICVEPDSNKTCDMAGTMLIEYFPAGVAWNCVAVEVKQKGWPTCNPDFTSAHITSKARIVILPNHQQDSVYHDTEPMYRR
ncbi:hypothetical protein [Leifsonia sp. Root112D2]|uniref:hypothetical protein n=1 Tax=Leifsonia sp. Root112D2 TaxID=1736426 RepID=UPI0012F8C067|nr:hypothetical protein [Leifsonia sp. Root112D2]